MVKNFALAAIVALFATTTFAAPAGEATAGQHPAEKKEEKAATEVSTTETETKTETKKEEEKK